MINFLVPCTQRGIFSGDEKACKRKDLLEEVAPLSELKLQSAAFSSILDKEVSYVTLGDEAFDQFASEASESLYRYIRKLIFLVKVSHMVV